MIAALLIGLLTVTLGWLLTLVVFPLTWLLPGLVFLLVNALMIYIVGRMMRGFRVANFVTAFAGCCGTYSAALPLRIWMASLRVDMMGWVSGIAEYGD